jgi:hypothetical protein
VLAVALLAAAGFVVFSPDDTPATANGPDRSAGRTAAGNTPPPIGFVGDPRSADPCALLSVNSLGQYGKTFLEPNLGTFARCDLTTTLPDSATAVTSLELSAPEQYPQVPPVRGQLSEIQRPNPDPGKCRRYFVLPDLSVVSVSSVRTDSAPSAQLCAMSDAVVGDAYARVARAPIPRRTQVFDAASLARVDACTLVDDATLRQAVGPGYPTDRYFANWACSWGEDTKSIDLYYDRQWPLAEDPPSDQTRTTLHGHDAYVDPHDKDDRDGCGVTIVYRTYTPKLAPLDGTPVHRDEVVLVDYTDASRKGDLEAICATAKTVAAAVAAKLPKS